MTCERTQDALFDDLTPDERAALDAHLEACEGCRQQRDQRDALDAALGEASPPPVPVELADEVLAAAGPRLAELRDAGRPAMSVSHAHKLVSLRRLVLPLGLVAAGFGFLHLQADRLVPAPAIPQPIDEEFMVARKAFEASLERARQAAQGGRRNEALAHLEEARSLVREHDLDIRAWVRLEIAYGIASNDPLEREAWVEVDEERFWTEELAALEGRPATFRRRWIQFRGLRALAWRAADAGDTATVRRRISEVLTWSDEVGEHDPVDPASDASPEAGYELAIDLARRIGDHAATELPLRRLIERARLLSDGPEEARSYAASQFKELGFTFLRLGQIPEAIDAFREAEEAYQIGLRLLRSPDRAYPPSAWSIREKVVQTDAQRARWEALERGEHFEPRGPDDPGAAILERHQQAKDARFVRRFRRPPPPPRPGEASAAPRRPLLETSEVLEELAIRQRSYPHDPNPVLTGRVVSVGDPGEVEGEPRLPVRVEVDRVWRGRVKALTARAARQEGAPYLVEVALHPPEETGYTPVEGDALLVVLSPYPTLSGLDRAHGLEFRPGAWKVPAEVVVEALGAPLVGPAGPKTPAPGGG